MSAPTWLERFAPGWAAKRAGARLKLEMIAAAVVRFRQCDGAIKGRLHNDWLTPTESADASLTAQNLEMLRNRSRDLARNDPHAAAIEQEAPTAANPPRSGPATGPGRARNV